jgi:hypothetical protein
LIKRLIPVLNRACPKLSRYPRRRFAGRIPVALVIDTNILLYAVNRGCPNTSFAWIFFKKSWHPAVSKSSIQFVATGRNINLLRDHRALRAMISLFFPG